MVARTPPSRRAAGPVNESRGNGPAAPASAAATAPGFVDGKPTTAFYDADDGIISSSAGDDSPLAHVAFVEQVRERGIPLEHGGTVDIEVLEAAAAEPNQDPVDLASEIERIREFRKPLGAYSQKLALAKRRGYHRHWFNDQAGRIDEAIANGWTHVLGKDKKPIARCVGTGRDRGALYGFAMEIPEVFWLEDMQARHTEAQGKVDALKTSPFRAAPGTAKAADKGKFYDPSEHDAGPLQVVKA